MSVFHNHYFSRGPPIGSKHIEGLVKRLEGLQIHWLVVFQPNEFEKYPKRHIGSFSPRIGVKIKMIFESTTCSSMSLSLLVSMELEVNRGETVPHPEFSFPKICEFKILLMVQKSCTSW